MPLGDGKLGKMAAVEGYLEAAPARDLDRVVERLGNVLEQRRHLLGRLEVLLVAVASRTPRVGENPALLDADPCLVRLEVVTLEEPDVIAGDDRQPLRERQVDRRLETRLVAAATRALDAEVEPPRERRSPGVGAALGLPVRTVQQCLADIAAGTGRDGDDVARVLAHPRPGGDGNPGTAVGHVAARQQPGELPIARVVHCEQRQVTGVDVVRFRLDGQVDADDRLDARRDGGAVEAHHAEQVRAVGDCDRRHPERLRPLDERPDPQYAVDQRELGMQVQMHEAGIHDRPPPEGDRRSADFTGAKLRRWMGEGPNRNRASRCARVP